MNRLYITRTPVIFSMMMFFCVSLNADEKPDAPDADKQASGHVHHNHGNEAIAHMHHKLDDDQAPYKLKEAQSLKELNEMTIRDDVKIEHVHAKIDELMAAKNQIMRLRYEHLIEMRQTLTDEQKVKYDQNVLNRSEVR